MHVQKNAPALKALALGSPGILAVVLLVPSPPGIPPVALALNPMVLLFLASLAGARFAPSLGLRSSLLLSDRWNFETLIIFFLIAIMSGSFIGIADDLAAPLWRPVGSGYLTLLEASNLSSLGLGLLYGGLTEEIILRWGLMSFIAATLSRFFGLRAGALIGLWIAAVLFALGHLPGILVLDPHPSLGVLIRTGGLNLVVGLLFGLAVLKLQLEAAIVAHMGFHLGVAVAAWFLVL